MQRKLTLMMGLFATAVMLTVLMSANAQDATPFPPEATVIPEGAVFTRPGRCIVSPDETQVAFNKYAIFNLADGEKLFDITGTVTYSADGRYVAVNHHGIVDSQTGELLIELALEENRFNQFSPNSAFYLTRDGLYDLLTSEQLFTFPETASSINFLPNNDLIIYHQPVTTVFPPEIHITVYQSPTWDKIIDTNNYQGQSQAYIAFDTTLTRVAMAGVGVFSYPDMTLLYELSLNEADWQLPIFNNDGSILLVMQPDNASPQHIDLAFMDAATGQTINQFSLISLDPQESFYFLSEDFTKIAIRNVIQTDTGERVYADNWRIIDVPTNTIIAQVNNDDVTEIYSEFGFDAPRADSVVHGRYVLADEGVFDAETEQLILPLVGLGNLSLTAGGSYVVSQNPCMVWRLP